MNGSFLSMHAAFGYETPEIAGPDRPFVLRASYGDLAYRFAFGSFATHGAQAHVSVEGVRSMLEFYVRLDGEPSPDELLDAIWSELEPRKIDRDVPIAASDDVKRMVASLLPYVE